MQLSLPRLIGRKRRQKERAAARSKETSQTRAARRIRTDPFTEEFRLLAMNVMALLEGSPLKAVTVFSLTKGDGRTRVAVELGRALALKTDVLLIDGQANSTGLHESLLITGPTPASPQPAVPRTLIPTDHKRLWLADGSRETGTEGDIALRMKEAMAAGMIVLVDAPASESSSDAFLLAQRTKNVLYVMRNKPQDMAPHSRAMQHLRRLDASILGIVLNDR
jgi:Mrp family chromosome partitioning ATPase